MLAFHVVAIVSLVEMKRFALSAKMDIVSITAYAKSVQNTVLSVSSIRLCPISNALNVG